MSPNRNSVGAEFVSLSALPPEFTKFDKPHGYDQHIVNLLVLISNHVLGAYYIFYLLPSGHVPKTTFLLALLWGQITELGITVGSHRYWTHRTFKAKKPLQILLMLMHTAAFSYPIFKWCRDHRVHHKYTDTNADPHSSARGLLFSHFTWLIQPKHPELVEKLKIVDVSDLVNDPIVRFQSKHYTSLAVLMCLVVPFSLCRFVFPEMSLFDIWTWNSFRYVLFLHISFMVNSVAHKYGDKPYNKHISPTENVLASILTGGEGWHNYHHTFPWDYNAAEFGSRYNLSTAFIHFFAWIGWAYDLKTVSPKLLLERINRTGDGSHLLHNKFTEGNLSNEGSKTVPNLYWGWGDKEMEKEDENITTTMFPKNKIANKFTQE